jgi:hypothetical protein
LLYDIVIPAAQAGVAQVVVQLLRSERGIVEFKEPVMPRIRCYYLDCLFLDDGYCAAATLEIDPDVGCLTYSPAEDLAEEDWKDEREELEEWKAIELEDEEDETRLDDEES